MQLSQFLAVINISQRVKEAKENWFPLLVIIIGTVTYSVTVTSATEAVIRQQVETTRLEQIGVAWILFGALWTALGAHLNNKDRDSLDLMVSQNSLNTKEIVRIFKAASNYSTFGAFMIILGTVVLLYKIYLH